MTRSAAEPPDWSDGTTVAISVFAAITSHPDLVVTPSVDYVGWFTLTHRATGMRLIDVADVEEGRDKAALLRHISFAEVGEPDSELRRELARAVAAALRDGAA